LLFTFDWFKRVLTMSSDLAAPDVSKLSLDTASSLQRQKAADGQQRRRAGEAAVSPTAEEALAAPLASRPAGAAPAAVMWSPDVGIRFGASGPAPATTGQAGMEAPAAQAKAQWSPGKGIRFN
jgi:hypothetical protein